MERTEKMARNRHDCLSVEIQQLYMSVSLSMILNRSNFGDLRILLYAKRMKMKKKKKLFTGEKTQAGDKFQRRNKPLIHAHSNIEQTKANTYKHTTYTHKQQIKWSGKKTPPCRDNKIKYYIFCILHLIKSRDNNQ